MSLPLTRVSACAALSLLVLLPGAGRAATKKLIEFGWGEPSTAFMRKHIAQMEKSPFDGCVFHIDYRKPDGAIANMTWEVWGTHAFRREDVLPAIEDLKATRFRRFQHNFLRFNTSPGGVDWFDDFSAVLHNARLYAEVAREGGVAGIWLDPEQYHSKLFDFPRQKDAGRRSFEEYARQVRRRGYQVMEAFQDGYPDLTLFVSFGYAMPWRGRGGRLPLSESSYGLLPAFLDGMIDAARGGTRIVDGQETTYPIRQPWEITAAREEMRSKVLPIVADPDKYRRVVSCAFGIWMDYDWRKHGWNLARTSKNFRPPGTLERVVRKALQATDEYVWVYSESPRWWTAEGKTSKLPAAYVSALWRARAAVIGTATPAPPRAVRR